MLADSMVARYGTSQGGVSKHALLTAPVIDSMESMGLNQLPGACFFANVPRQQRPHDCRMRNELTISVSVTEANVKL